MPPKKNEALIEKFKRANEFRRTFGVANAQIPNIKAKIKDSCEKLLQPYNEALEMIKETIVHIDDRLKYIEGLLFEDEKPEEKKSS